MNVDNMNEKGIDEALTRIMTGLIAFDDLEVKREILETIVNQLEYYSQDDTFGTEGWKHSFGVE